MLDNTVSYWLSENNKHSVISEQDENYPSLLKQINAPPPLLYVYGDPTLLSLPQVAIVGSRTPTPAGRETARRFAALLAQAGIIVTSGMAFGIDAAAHQGALQYGKTIAVLGSGLNQIYPKQHRALFEAIAEKGAVISELPLDALPKREHFPQRNRIISGLSMGVVVVEAALQSGSLITARFAGEQGREIFAMPGSIHNPMAKGCHQLIRQGAKLVETVQDILEELKIFLSVDSWLVSEHNTRLSLKKLDKDHQRLLRAIGFEATAPETLMQRTQFSFEIMTSMLLKLEMTGYIRAIPGGYCRLI